MSTSPAIVSIGEPLIEFNRPREGDGRTWLQGFGGDSQNVAIAALQASRALALIAWPMADRCRTLALPM